MARARRRTRRFQRGNRKLIWHVASYSALVVTSGVTNVATDDVIVMGADDWKVVNVDANEKCTLLRSLVWMTGRAIQEVNITSPFSWSRVLYVTDEDAAAANPSIVGQFLIDEDVLYYDMFFPNITYDQDATPTRMVATGAPQNIDSRVKRKLEAGEEVRFLNRANTAATNPSQSGIEYTFVAKLLIQIS